MLVKSRAQSQEILAGDHTLLRELLHPARDAAEIRYSLAHAQIRPGTSSLPHRLATSEVYYFISGNGRMHVGECTTAVGPDLAVYVPPRTTQYVENTGGEDLVFLCIVDPAWRSEDEEVEVDRPIKRP
jgi:mannose-6-phosphate isomerase-like protein (cupin superfamily)